MRRVLADVTVLLWIALSIAYGLTHTERAQFFQAYLPTFWVVIIGMFAFPMAVLVLGMELFRRPAWPR